MLKDSIAHNVISAGLELGADFVDLFIENNRGSTISFLDKKIKDIKTGTDFGIGIRVIFGDQAIYGYTNSLLQDELVRIIRLLCALKNDQGQLHHSRLSSSSASASLNFSPATQTPQGSITSKTGVTKDLFLEEKILFLRRVDELTREFTQISQVDISCVQRWQNIEIYNSEGLHIYDHRPYTRIYATAIAQDGGQQASAFTGPAGLCGWELAQLHPPEKIAKTIGNRVMTTLKAGLCPAGRMPVIIDNGFGGVIFHEACGHLLETTSIEKKASVFHDKMHQMIAHPAVSAFDDGTIDQEWGSINIDDEGMPTQKTQLISEGKLVGFLVDRIGEIKTGYQRTGSARRQSYKFAPASRMRNTYIAPGPYSLEELIASVDEGLYAKAMGGGSVVPGTGEFNFSVEEAYLIKKGKLGPAVKGATLIGTGPEVLTKISKVGNNFKLEPGMCGSVSGSVPVTVGQAALKVDEILVGGKAL